MGIRMGSSQFMYNYQLTLNRAYQKQAKLFEQADGSSIHRASDDPMAYSKLLRYNVNDNENTQYRENIKSATSWMQSSDSVMTHMTEIMQTLKEKSVAAANSDKVDDDYMAIYKEMEGISEELVSVANTQLSDRYLFAGQKDLTKPFTLSEKEYERGLTKTLDTQQAAFFKGATGDYNTKLYQMLELERDGETYFLDNESGNIYTADFVANGYKEVRSLGYTTISDAEEAASSSERVKELLKEGCVDTVDLNSFKISNYFTNQGLLVNDNTTGFDAENYTYSFKTISQRIVTYNGDENLISMVKLNGATDPNSDTVNSTGARMFGRDIFDDENSGNEASGSAMLNQIFCVVKKTEICDFHWMSSDGVSVTDVANTTLLVEQTRVGARQQLYNSVETMLDTQADNITEDITNISSTDIAQLATKLMQMTTLYNLSLSLGGRILPQSLADYL